MQVIKVELLSEKALQLLQQLEQLNVLRLLTPENKNEEKASSPRNWVGSISTETAQQLLAQTEQSRKEWERDI
ncbi:MAG: hypothetical protein AAFQ68_23945 [Bacteroidota bacterium]